MDGKGFAICVLGTIMLFTRTGGIAGTIFGAICAILLVFGYLLPMFN